MAISERTPDLAGDCPTNSALLPRIRGAISERPAAGFLQWQINRIPPATAGLHEVRGEKRWGHAGGNSGVDDVVGFQRPRQPIQNHPVLETDAALPRRFVADRRNHTLQSQSPLGTSHK